MSRGKAALVGAVVGLVAGVVLLLAFDPVATYTNDAYRQGAVVGYVLRHMAFGAIGALLLHTVLRGERRRALAGAGIAGILVLAALPIVLDRDEAPEPRQAAPSGFDNADRRIRAEAIAGCTDGMRQRQRRGEVPEAFDAEGYCTCFIDGVAAAPGDDGDQILALDEQTRDGRLTPRLDRLGTRCANDVVG